MALVLYSPLFGWPVQAASQAGEMQLTVRDVAEFLSVSERTVYRMIQGGEIPACRVHNQFRFNRTELLEWAMAHHINVSPGMLRNEETGGEGEAPKLSEALRQGGIFYRLESGDKPSALRAMINVLRLPDDVDRELLFRMHLARESLASTGIGEGIAIPHVRNPIILQCPTPQITLCFLETPVDFQAVDGKPVFALFSMITPTIRVHLLLLSRLAYVLKDDRLRAVIRSRAAEESIMAEFARMETPPAPGSAGPAREATP